MPIHRLEDRDPLNALGNNLQVPLSIAKTLRGGIRAAWDSLGLVCASSLTLFVGFALPLFAGMKLAAISGKLSMALAVTMVTFLLIVPALAAGISFLAHRVITRDEPSYSDLWIGFVRLYSRSVAIAAVQAGVIAVLGLYVVFYFSRGGLGWILAGIACGYMLVFWGMNCLYHWPLLIASDQGIIKRDDGGRARLISVFRNGFLLASSAPGYTFGLLAFLIALGAPLAISGVGMALIFPGFATILAAQATHDQMVRFGLLPIPPDMDEPLREEAWRVKSG